MPRYNYPVGKKKEEVEDKNTPSYLVHFYPLKQFQHCFKIVLSRVIVLCMHEAFRLSSPSPYLSHSLEGPTGGLCENT